jgi:hypothetical protein
MPLMVEVQLIRIARVIMLELELWMIRPKGRELMCVSIRRSRYLKDDLRRANSLDLENCRR